MYQIAISAAAKGKTLVTGKRLAQEAGAAVAKTGNSLFTGATTGLPHDAAVAYKQAGGEMSIGISPAATKIEHVLKYRLPTRPYDAIIYTGMHYSGRDAFLINSADAVISIGGRLGTLHEAMIALETDTPIGFLQGAGGTSEQIMTIMKSAGREAGDQVVFGDDATVIMKMLMQILDKDHKQYREIYTHP